MKLLIPLLAFFFVFAFFSCKSSAPSVVPETLQEMGESAEREDAETGTKASYEDATGADIDAYVEENLDDDTDVNVGAMEEFERGEFPGYTPGGEESAGLMDLAEIPLAEGIGETVPEGQPLVPSAQLEAEPRELPPVSVPAEAPFAFPRVFPPEVPELGPTAQSPVQEQRPPEQAPVQEQRPPDQAPVQEQRPPGQAPLPRQPPQPFARPVEPEVPSPERQQVPAQEDSNRLVPELPSRVSQESPDEGFVFSRVVRLTVGQMLEIPFRGTGWVYLGELGNRRGLSYDSRRLDLEAGLAIGQSFIFRADASGTYILKFYKQDFIQDYIINDYVQVIVGERADDSGNQPGFYIDRGRLVAEPRWPPVPGPEGVQESARPGPSGLADGQAAGSDTGQVASPTAGQVASPVTDQARSPATDQAVSPETGQTAVEPFPATPAAEAGSVVGAGQAEAGSAAGFPADALPEEFVRRARQEFDDGRVEQALGILDLMMQRFPNGTDEAWWLYAQLLEANSPSRDIKLALEYYRRIVEEYPQSNRVGDARGRIAYLERFYINIR